MTRRALVLRTVVRAVFYTATTVLLLGLASLDSAALR